MIQHNNADIAKAKIRELQSLIYSNQSSRDDLFKLTESIIQYLDKASNEIKTNYENISKKLTERLNNGVLNG